MTSLDLAYLSATEALQLFRTRALSPVELLDAVLERIESVEGKVNSLSSQRVEYARQQARAAEQVYLSRPEGARALEGIPVALKNEHTFVGDSTTLGSTLLKGTVDRENAPITDRLIDAGAVIHAKTNVPEFCCAMFTSTREYGVTRNPWQTRVSCGGSSGGSAAALAAGETTLATGSDIGGSIRVPASLCGVVGLKPSYGRVPEGVYEYAMNTYNHNGPMARTVGDCALMFSVINGAHPMDPATVLPPLTIAQELGGLENLSIAVSVDLGYFDVHPEVLRNTETVAAALRDLGARVELVDLAWTHDARDAAYAGLLFPMGRHIAQTVETGRELANDYTCQFVDAGMKVTPKEYLEHFRVMSAMDRALQRVLAEHDVLLCPSLAVTELPAEGSSDSLNDIFRMAMTYPFNMLSRHPVLNVPSGFASNGVPTGVQIVGRRLEDERVLQVGAALERLLQWARCRPNL